MPASFPEDSPGGNVSPGANRPDQTRYSLRSNPRVSEHPTLHHRTSTIDADAELCEVGWQLTLFHPEHSQSRRRRGSERASRRRGVRARHLQVGDKVILKDRKLGGKYCMPYEPGIWTVSQIQGTMITTLRGHEKVTRNILWFLKVNLPADPEERTEVEEFMRDAERRSPKTPASDSSDIGLHPRDPDQPEPLAQTEQPEVVPLRYRPHHPRPIPPTSQKLRDFA
ncbi:hypothetical protein NDU88_007299 [Pleurodeles waltl]|uniref:Uncharacterized protein n=1 Tax=Pleurodeles waltl TaxID=8319 RepID=A0AAV7RUM6_PLEWA|nr:hypothetical protein NDU88_007299 [Pleurodeles waltl]